MTKVNNFQVLVIQNLLLTPTKGGYPAGDTKYTVFGQVIKGMDVVDTIANLEVDQNNKPKETVDG